MGVESDADLLAMFDAAEFGVAATWNPAPARGLPFTDVAVTIIADDEAGLSASGIARQVEAAVPRPALPADPQRGDTLAIGAATWRVDAATSAIDRRVWRLTLVTG